MDEICIVLDNLIQILVPIAIGCVLPIMIVRIYNRRKASEDQSRTQIIMALIEKNPNLDIEETLKKFAPEQKPKLLKEKLLTKLLWGIIASSLGVGLIILDICICYAGGANGDLFWQLGLISGTLTAGGIAFLIYYFVGKKMLAKEIEAELNQLTTKA
ncbi:MAG: hypothetical protein IKZ99_10415 [Salinivirgaceae bacterium]|nr:hypothetical protein [Salinivirgaceae bacterium]